MNIMDSKINASILSNRLKAKEKSGLKKTGDTFIELVNLGLVSNTSVSEHGIWQVYNGILSHIPTSDLINKGKLIDGILPSVKEVIETYKEILIEAEEYGLIKEKTYKKSLK